MQQIQNRIEMIVFIYRFFNALLKAIVKLVKILNNWHHNENFNFSICNDYVYLNGE